MSQILLNNGAAPSVPAAGKVTVYSKTDKGLYYKDEDGTETGPLSSSGTGDVTGPASAVAGGIALFDGTSGKIIKDSTLTTAQLALLGTSTVQALNVQLLDGLNTDQIRILTTTQVNALGTSQVLNISVAQLGSLTTADVALLSTNTAMQDPTGFVNPDAIQVDYNYTNRTITLTGTLTYYWNGVLKTLISPWTSSAHANAEDNYYLSSSDGVNFIWATSAWSFSNIQAAFVHRGASAASSYAVRETHGLMPWMVHRELHSQIGTYRSSGGSLTAGTYTENTDSDVATTPGFDLAVLQDEDLATTLPAWTQGTYTTMYIGASSIVTFNVASSFPFTVAASYLRVNNVTTGAMTDGATGRYYNVYQILLPAAADSDSQKFRMIMLQPQNTFTSLASAQLEDPRLLVFGDFAPPEYTLYARITYVTSAGDANTGKCRIATGGVSYLLGNRLSPASASGFSPTNHAALSNLDWANTGHNGTASTFAAFDSSGLPVTIAQNTIPTLGTAQIQALNVSLLAGLNTTQLTTLTTAQVSALGTAQILGISVAQIGSLTTADIVTLTGSQELTNKTLNAAVLKGTLTASGTVTLPAHTLGGAITGAGQNVSGLGTLATGGNVGIGTSASATVGLKVSAATTGVAQQGLGVYDTFGSDATTHGIAFYSGPATTAASYTMTSAYGAYLDNWTKGSGSTITTQYGLYVTGLTSGATNYAIYTNAGLVRFGDAVTMTSTLGCGAITSTGNVLSTSFYGALGNGSGNGQDVTVRAGFGTGGGNSGGHLYLGSGRGNSTATNGNIYLGCGKSTDAVGLQVVYTTITSTGINSTDIGATTPGTGAFTTLSASGLTTIGIGGAGATDGNLYVDGSSASDHGAQIAFRRASSSKGNIGTSSVVLGGAASDIVYLAAAGLGHYFHANGSGTATAGITSTGLAVTGTLSATGITSVTDATDATSTTAASLKTAGGLAVAKKAYFGHAVIAGGFSAGTTADVQGQFGAVTANVTGGAGATTLVPTTNAGATLYVVSGEYSGDRFYDLVFARGAYAPVVISSNIGSGSPGARTYTTGSEVLNVAIAGTANTYNVRATLMGSSQITF